MKSIHSFIVDLFKLFFDQQTISFFRDIFEKYLSLKKIRFYWINRPKKEFRRLYWNRISFTNVSRSLALQCNRSGRFVAFQPSVAPHVSIALPVEEERSLGWGISSNTRKAPLENTHDHPWTLAPSLHMGTFSVFGYPLAHLLLFLSFFLAESRDFLSDQHRGNNAYLTRDEHWFNQTLDHFSPTACLLFFVFSFPLLPLKDSCNVYCKISIHHEWSRI